MYVCTNLCAEFSNSQLPGILFRRPQKLPPRLQGVDAAARGGGLFGAYAALVRLPDLVGAPVSDAVHLHRAYARGGEPTVYRVRIL